MAIGATRKHSDSMVPLKDQGVEYLAAAAKGGVAIQTSEVTISADPHTVTLADLGLTDMADTNYDVYVGGGPLTTVPTLDRATKATTGFNLVAGTATDICSVLIVGRLAGMSPDPSDV